MDFKKLFIGLLVVIFVAVAALAFVGGLEKNNTQNWQVVQPIQGEPYIRAKSGWYLKWGADVWTYPKYADYVWDDKPGNEFTELGSDEIESIETRFNDGGTAQISAYVKYSTPTSVEDRLAFHEQFAGSIESATKNAVGSHLANCIKVTGPLMSASENQAARKAEFTQLVWDQLEKGLYKVKKTRAIGEPSLSNSSDGNSEPILRAELITDKDGNPIVDQPSPLLACGIKIIQFSIKETKYDERTKKQFETKKDSLLAAEQSKADREKEKQERLNIIEKGLREVAEAQAAANVVKEKAVVEAQQKAEVAEQAKKEAETKAQMALSVAEIKQQEEEALLAAAQLEAQRVKVIAEAEQEAIQKAGKLTEVEQYQMDTSVKIAEVVSKNVSNIASPEIIINGGGAGADGNGGGVKDLIDNSFGLYMLKMLGGTDQMNMNQFPMAQRVVRPEAETVNN